MPSRTLRYSGSDRPAWRMNHTGVCGTGSRAAGPQEGGVGGSGVRGSGAGALGLAVVTTSMLARSEAARTTRPAPADRPERDQGDADQRRPHPDLLDPGQPLVQQEAGQEDRDDRVQRADDRGDAQQPPLGAQRVEQVGADVPEPDEASGTTSEGRSPPMLRSTDRHHGEDRDAGHPHARSAS